MSELKPYIGPHPTDHTLTEYYLKSEADKVISELIEKNNRLAHKDIIMASETIKDLEESHKMEVEQLLMEIVELKDKLQNVSEPLKETREWLIESQKMHKRCADNAIKQLCHNKHKRCLAMAKWCDSEMNYWYDRIEMEQCQRFKFYDKWHKRWLELAEQFKEAK